MPKPRYFAQRRDLMFAAAYLLLAVLMANCVLWYGVNLGTGISVGALTLLTAAYLWPTRRRIGCYGVFCLVGALACAVSFAWSGDSAVKTLTLLLAAVLSTCAVVDMQGLWLRGKDSFRFVGDLCKWSIGYPLGHCGAALWALFHRQNPDGSAAGRRTGSVILGLVCALPVLVVLVPLLMSSDAAFEGLLNRVNFDTLIELIVSVILGAGLFLLLFSQGFLLPRYEGPMVKTRQPGRGVGQVGLGAFLAVICALYVLYLASQLAYFFSGFAGILPEGYTAAEYARRGFFEMTAVCAINLALLFVCLLIVRKPEGRAPLSIRLMGLFICLFSLVLITTALSKMGLYINRYGMTRLRVLTSVFMVFLAVCFVCVSLRLLLRRFGYMQPVLAAGVVLLIALSFEDCDRFMARYNYAHWQSGQLEELDVDHLGRLGHGAVPILWEVAQGEDADMANKARAYLTMQGEELLQLTWYDDQTQAELSVPRASARSTDLRAYNRDTTRAVQILLEHWDDVYIAEYWTWMS